MTLTKIIKQLVSPHFCGFRRRTARTCVGILALFIMTLAGLASGQAVPKSLSVDVPLQPNSTQPEAIPKPTKVRNETVVTVRVIGLSPLETCKLGDRKAADIQAASDLEPFIKMLSSFGAFGFGPGSAEEELAKGVETHALKITEKVETNQDRNGKDNKENKATGPPPAFAELYNLTAPHVIGAGKSLSQYLMLQQDDWERVRKASEEFAKLLGKDFRGSRQEQFKQAKKEAEDLVKVAEKPAVKPGGIDAIQADTQEAALLLSLIHKQFDSELAKTPDELNLIARLDEQNTLNQTALSRVLETAKALDDQRKALVTANEMVRRIPSPAKRNLSEGEPNKMELTQRLPLPKDRNAKVTESVSCVSLLDKTKITLDPVPVSVTYQNPPRIAFSMGILLSTLKKREIGTSPVKTGSDSSGVSTFKNTFAITDQADAQAIPFAFLNFRVYDRQLATHDFTFNLSGGAGVNPNSGTKEPEFFSGVALGFDRMLVHIGMHTGRLQHLGGGFQLDETVPDKFPTTLPIVRSYENRFAIGLSFRMLP